MNGVTGWASGLRLRGSSLMAAESPRLTRQQKRVLRYLLREDESNDYYIESEACVRAHPTVDNLIAKGLVCNIEFVSYGLEDQEGWIRGLTPLGREVAEGL